MRTLKKRRRIQVVVVIMVSLFLATGLIGYAFRDGINLFRAPSQVFEHPPKENEVFRLGGLVKTGSLERTGTVAHFVVTDGAKDIPVTFTGVLPDLFAEDAGMIATGKMEGNTFIANEIVAKHDENYTPKEVVDALKEQGVYMPKE